MDTDGLGTKQIFCVVLSFSRMKFNVYFCEDFSDGVGKRRRGYGAGAFVIELVKIHFGLSDFGRETFLALGQTFERRT